MLMKKSSYQKLKEKNNELNNIIQKLYDDPEYYLSQVMANNIRKGIDKAAMFGSPYFIHKPSGEVELSGVFKQLLEC